MMSAGTLEISLHTSFGIAQGEGSQNLPASCPIDELFLRCHLNCQLRHVTRLLLYNKSKMKGMNECDVNDYTIKWCYTITLTI